MVNVTYSYAIIKAAAISMQEKDEWSDSKTISKLLFTNRWIKSFLTRGGLSRRKITREDKDVPGSHEINTTMAEGQRKYIDNDHDENTCFNFDETAFTWAIGPTHVYCPANQQRATNIGISNTKLRITAVIAVNAAGVFAPLMLILKHSVSSEKCPDQTKMLVIQNLHKVEGFREVDGWKLKVWADTLTIGTKTDVHRIIYLIHDESKHVITSQCKAWNNSIRMVMWYQVVMAPLKDVLGKMLLWCDNCGSHRTECVKKAIGDAGIDVAFLPRNMTGELQVLDLVVNGPLKAHIRKNRANRLYENFQTFRTIRIADEELPRNIRKHPNFVPPKPTLLEGIRDLLSLMKKEMREERFKQSIKRSFIKTGTLPIIDDDITHPVAFEPYKKESMCGTMSCVPAGTTKDYEDENEDVVVEVAGESEDEHVLGAMLPYLENRYLDCDDIENDPDLQEDDDW